MKTYLDCIVCLLRQSLEAARFAGADEEGQKRVLMTALDILYHNDPTSTPPQIASKIHQSVREVTGNMDPYQEIKERSTGEALSHYPAMKQLVQKASDPLTMAIKMAIAGNIIDYGRPDPIDLGKIIEQTTQQPLEINHINVLKSRLQKVPWLLYLADNAGETVFDRVLIEELRPLPVKYAVKGGASLNDATRKDALEAGLDKIAEIVDTGYPTADIIPECSSPEFLELLENAPLVIAKGQGNYESLSEYGERFFFLLQVKCEVLARDVGTPVKSWVVKQGGQTT